MDLKKLLTRSCSGLIYVFIIVAGLLYNQISLCALVMLLAGLGTAEFIKITKGFDKNHIIENIIDILASISLTMSFYLYPVLLWIILIMVRMIMEIYKTGTNNSLKDLSLSMLSQIYIAFPLALMVILANIFHPEPILLIFILIWINDTGAYIVGCTIGRHRLYEKISPKKSWEGFFGGLVFTIVTAVLCGMYATDFFRLPSIIWLWVVIAIIVTIFGTWGDLIESMIKRNLHIKDSGNIIPGHGGILDRIDSLLLVLPVMFVFLILISWTTALF